MTISRSKPALIITLLVFAVPCTGVLWNRTRQIRAFYRVHPALHPKGKFEHLSLVNDFNRDGYIEEAAVLMDERRSRDAIFDIYAVKFSGMAGTRDRLLYRLVTRDYYCTGIEFRNVDGLPGGELLFHTTGKDPNEKNLHIVSWNAVSSNFEYMLPDVKINSWKADYIFTRRSINHPPELQVISSFRRPETLFQKYDQLPGLAGVQPGIEQRQIYIITNRRLVHFETTVLNTPLYVLDKFLKAIRQKRAFAAYRHFQTDEPYFRFRNAMTNRYPLLTDEGVHGAFELNNWYLHYFRRQRLFGWMTFSYLCTVNARKHLFRYQVFMKKIYDEWKITAVRVIRRLKLEQ